MYSITFWKRTLERVVGSFAASLLSVLTFSGALDVVHVGWKQALAMAAFAAVVTALKSVVGSTIGDDKNPGWVN
jgi:r1t holin